MTRPEDIPAWAWDEAWETLHPMMRRGYETSPLAFVQHLGIAKAILKAKKDAFEWCAAYHEDKAAEHEAFREDSNGDLIDHHVKMVRMHQRSASGIRQHCQKDLR